MFNRSTLDLSAFAQNPVQLRWYFVSHNQLIFGPKFVSYNFNELLSDIYYIKIINM